MEVDCNDCGRCCLSPFQPNLIELVKDHKSKECLLSIVPPLIKKGIILPDRPVRSGTILRQEMNTIINEGLVVALAPDAVAYKEEIKFRVIGLRLRHIMMSYNLDGTEVPVFACVFFNSKNKKCQIYNMNFKPVSCELFPFDESYKYELLRRNGQLNDRILVSPICGLDKIKGELTLEQIKQIETNNTLIQQSPDIPDITNKDEFIQSFLNTPSSFISIYKGALDKLKFVHDYLPLTDHRYDLEEILEKVIRRYHRRYFKNHKEVVLSPKQKEYQGFIRHKINQSIKSWENIIIKEGEEQELLENYKKLFPYRLRTSPMARDYYSKL